MNSLKNEFHISDLVIDDEYGTIESEMTIVDAAKKMKELNVPDLVILDKAKNDVLGVIADFDIVQNVVADGLDPGKTKVTSAMYSIEPVTLKTSVKDAFAKMQKLNVNVVPVVENKKLLGVATIQDCWGYIPDINPDEIGMIPVSNPKNAEFWLASTLSFLALIIGIILPLIGAVGYYSADPKGMAGEEMTYYLFEAHNVSNYTSLLGFPGFLWTLTIISSFLLLICGIIGVFSLVYTSYSDSKGIKTGNFTRNVLPWLSIIMIIIQWIFLGLALNKSADSLSIDGIGLALSIISILCLVIAIFRDYLFKEITINSKEAEN